MGSPSDVGSPKREPTPTSIPLSSIPQKRALDEGHSPAIPSPLNPEVKSLSDLPSDDAVQATRFKSSRAKKDTLKKRESKGANHGGDSARATPDPKSKPPVQSEQSPLRYKLAPPKPSDFELPRGPVMTFHHEVSGPNGEAIEFFETSDQ